jgi:hypothetical protein
MIVHTIPRSRFKRAALLFVSIFVPLVIIETGYQMLHVYKGYKRSIRKSDIDFDRFDPYFGWVGTPGNKGLIHGPENSFYFVNNSSGFRDIEHDKSSNEPAIVFLGGSFPWGFGIPTEKMFVNLLRDMLKEYDIFNLAGVCYGTDQSLLIYKNWANRYKGRINRVILMATDKDVERNSTSLQCERGKPKFEIVRDELVLTGIPVPQIVNTQQQEPKIVQPESKISWKTRIRRVLIKSRFLNALYDRYARFRKGPTPVEKSEPFRPAEYDLRLTYKILEELKRTVEASKAELVAIFIPSYDEIDKLPGYRPYQQELISMCEKLGIVCHDLSPSFKNTGRKAYDPAGYHWNSYGHILGAEAIYNFLISETGLKTQDDEIKTHEANSNSR